MKNILLLTSTIRPKANQPQLKLADPEERLTDYRQALDFYVRLVEQGVLDKIVYADNSGVDLKCLSERFSADHIEWIGTYDLGYDSSYHRGYGEFRLVDHAFAASRILSSLGKDDRIWKVTGRYQVKNLANVIAMTPRQFDLYCNVKGDWAEMGFMAWSRVGYERVIKGIWQNFATGKVPELILAEHLKSIPGNICKVVTSFYWPPFIDGRRGSDGSQFQGRFTRIKFLLALGHKSLAWPFRRLLSTPMQQALERNSCN
jgi:hypothetical protein